eukprot:3433409-Alexandrium_andersonii.AAC.1
MGGQAQEGATQSQSQRLPTRNTQSQGRRPNMCSSIAVTEQPTRKALDSEPLAGNRSDRRGATLAM